METKVVKLGYYNVCFSLYIKCELDMIKISYLAERVKAGESFLMRDIYEWCMAQNIECSTQFFYRRDFSLLANLWNFYSYIRGIIDRKRRYNYQN